MQQEFRLVLLVILNDALPIHIELAGASAEVARFAREELIIVPVLKAALVAPFGQRTARRHVRKRERRI